MRDLKQAKIEEIRNVKGSTIDVLCNPTKKEGFKRMVHTRALQKYFYNSAVKERMFDDVPIKELFEYFAKQRTTRDRLGNIHWIVLHGPKDMDLASLCISSDGKYLRTIDNDGFNTKIWDVEQGLKTNLSDKDPLFDDVKWIKSQGQRIVMDSPRKYYFVTDKADNYYAKVFSQLTFIGGNGHVELEYREQPAILIFKRPNEASYLCHEAYHNSKHDLLELAALRDSKSYATIKGFPKNNFKKRLKST